MLTALSCFAHVQDLKQLTAQRTHRQRMEYWDLQARNSPRRTSSSNSSDWTAHGSPASSTSSSSSSTRSDSPPRQFSKNNVYAYPPYGRGHGSSSYHNNQHHHHHHHHYYASRGSPSLSPSGEPEKMFVTCGGQVVSFMEGVVNAPQFDFLPEMLNATL